jgi:transposase
MDRDDLRRFVDRDWAALAASKAAYWAGLPRRDRPTWTAGQALLAHARAVRHDFPAPADRQRDLDDHLALCERLDRVAHAFPCR